MTLKTAMVKPFASAWRASSYFGVAFVFWAIHSTIPTPFSSVDQAHRQWWQDLIDKAVGSFDKISYFLFLAGLIYAVLSDAMDYIWSNSLQKEVQKGFSETGTILTNSLGNYTSGLIAMSFESVKVWVEGGRGSPDQVRSVAKSALVNHYGQHNSANNNLLDFIVTDLMDNWVTASSQIWENFSSNVIVRPSKIRDHFEWEESRNYDVVCHSRSGELPLRLEGSMQINVREVLAALDQMEFRIRFGQEQVVDFKKWWTTNKKQIDPDRFRIEAEGIAVEYDGLWLRYEISRQCSISDERTGVAIFEKSYISPEDRSYSLALRHPTRGVRISLSIEGMPNWVVKEPVASAVLYERDRKAVQIATLHKHSCSAVVSGWTLPGVAVVIEWVPGQPD